MAGTADNARRGFKCVRCGTMFEARGNRAICPSCGYYCLDGECQRVDVSDEGY